MDYDADRDILVAYFPPVARSGRYALGVFPVWYCRTSAPLALELVDHFLECRSVTERI
jgi:hypothetical protein